MQHSELSGREAGEVEGTRATPSSLARELEDLRVRLAARDAEIEALQRERDLTQRALEQQARKLAAAEASALRQVERQAELRALLLDAHEQLALRDDILARVVPREQPPTALTSFITRARSWRQRLKSRLGRVRS